MAASSGTTGFAPPFSDLLLDAFARIQVRPSAITADHCFQARMSANLVLAEWSTRDGPCLWKMEQFTVPLVQGVATYVLPTDTIAILDFFVRQFTMNAAVSVPCALTTVSGSTTVTVYQVNHGLTPGAYLNFVVPVAVGGIIVYGTYQTITVLDANTYTIDTANPALNPITSGGATPLFTTIAGNTGVVVTLPYHGLVAGQQFMVEVPTTVGGIPLASAYTVVSVADINTFTITAQLPAAANDAVGENGGLAYIETQSVQADPQDRFTPPMSRSDYANQPDKLRQSFPTTIWFNRQINPQVTLWPVPDANGPYELHYWAMTQFDDVVVPNGVGLDMPWRFLMAFAASLAADLALKYPPPPPNSIEILDKVAERAWSRAANQDVENAPIYISPMLGGYCG